MRHAAVALSLGAMLTIGALVTGSVHAKDPAKPIGESEIAQARAAAKTGNLAQAGAILGALVVSAVRVRSVDAEQRAGEALEEILDDIERDATGHASGDATSDTWPGRAAAREVAAAVMKPLDPKRHGLFVSAHALAASIVLDAAALGDDGHLSEAAAVLKAYAATPKAGAAGVAFFRLAEGIRLARAGEDVKAVPALEDAARLGAPWLIPALHAYLELAMVRLKAGNAARSGEAIMAACALPPGDADLTCMKDWMHAVEVRWKDAPGEARDAFRKATTRFLGSSPGGQGGRGGKGASEGGDVSPLGRALPKWPAGKPFATAKRGKGGFEIRLPFDSQVKATEPLGPGSRAWDASGVTLLLAGPAVALRMADLEGTRGQPSERRRPSRGWAWYPLAEGETWGVTKDGVVILGP